MNRARATSIGALLLLGSAAAAGATVLTVSDGVIRNSLCVGADCPNSPSFSDTTILMMENNTRIKFDDTSVVGAFPRNDWEIEANSSVNGGQSYLGFNDCGESSQGGCATDLVFAVEAGARQSALYVESDGDVGIGTSNPVADLHVVTGNTPFLRLDQDGSAGFTPQTWDVAGNETNFFVRDVTTGSRLPLRIQPGASSNSIFVANDGDVGLGTSAPANPLHVRRTAPTDSVFLKLEATAAGGETLRFDMLSATGTWRFGTNAASNVFTINDLDNAGAELTLSEAGSLTILGDIFTASCAPCTTDYVFEPGYALLPLAELEEFIQENGHLPNVPSEAELRGRGGVPLALMQRRTLEKVEELVLYTLEQQRTIEELRARLEAVEARWR